MLWTRLREQKKKPCARIPCPMGQDKDLSCVSPDQKVIPRCHNVLPLSRKLRFNLPALGIHMFYSIHIPGMNGAWLISKNSTDYLVELFGGQCSVLGIESFHRASPTSTNPRLSSRCPPCSTRGSDKKLQIGVKRSQEKRIESLLYFYLYM